MFNKRIAIKFILKVEAAQIVVLNDEIRVLLSISNCKKLANSVSPISWRMFSKNNSVWFIANAAAFRCKLAWGLNNM